MSKEIFITLIFGFVFAMFSCEKGFDVHFRGEDIKSYNIETGEIVFENLKIEEIKNTFGLYTSVSFTLKGKMLFVPHIKIHSSVSSIASNDLQLQISPDNKLYLIIFYANFDWLPDDEKLKFLEEKEANTKKRQKELDVLINYLNEAGKIICP